MWDARWEEQAVSGIDYQTFNVPQSVIPELRHAWLWALVTLAVMVTVTGYSCPGNLVVFCKHLHSCLSWLRPSVSLFMRMFLWKMNKCINNRFSRVLRQAPFDSGPDVDVAVAASRSCLPYEMRFLLLRLKASAKRLNCKSYNFCELITLMASIKTV